MTETTRFDTPPEYAATLDALLARATWQIRIYDWDLSDGGYNDPARVELLTQFCRQNQGRQIKILLADDAWLTQHAGQMMQLLKTWGHVLQVRVRDSEPPPAQDCFVLVDNDNMLKRFDKDSAKGVMRLESRADVIDLSIRFESEWDRAWQRVSAHTLGL